ncbi:Gfo/Idh/MocA family oxidoreductase [Mobilitalea sibirica]|uniref:Gfo/Idh/MocA family oxidoreductase n=1 Tax=Mobilitalea sibirica TaxID=1462919 RepID=A0A8J7H1H5_9FIRM|nr:Gfo/Idh/MocA family oxidoreductase [Mobilitalea sibirica]MBH1940289.1 Gfo/Idh/MocA family oxidoreductase [Mobilitalea sibirica]
MNKIKWGIIGTGWISTMFATALSSIENTEMAAVASRDLGRAKDFAEKFKIKKAYGSYEELVKDPDVDVVYIGTPHSEHKDNAAMSIQNGKAVLCEKPITLNQKETQYLISLAKEHKVFLMEAMWTKFLPATRKVKSWLKDKRIGEVQHYKVSFGYYTKFDINSRLFNPDIAGGALLDVGIYPITYVTHMMEKLPDQIISSAVIGKSNVDEQNVIIFKYKEGILADLSSSVAVNTGKDAVIVGDKGKIVVPNFWMAETAMLYDAENNLVESFSEPFAVNGYVYEAEEVNRCLREGKLESEVVPLKDTLDIMKIMDEIRADWGLTYPQERG